MQEDYSCEETTEMEYWSAADEKIRQLEEENERLKCENESLREVINRMEEGE